MNREPHNPSRYGDMMLASNWMRSGEMAACFSRSAWSLAAIGRFWETLNGKSGPHVWLPGYFCDQSTQPLRATGAKLTFYSITEELEPNYPRLREMAGRQPPDIFLLVHYFGGAANAKEARAFCDRHRAVLVEDAAHVLRPIPQVGQGGEFVMYSPHKLLPVPHGAVLVMRPGAGVLADVAKQTVELVWRKAIAEFEQPSACCVGWLVKSLVKKLGFPSRLTWGKPVSGDFRHDPPPPVLKRVSGIGACARRVLLLASRDLAWVARIRRRNGRLWQHLLKKQYGLEPFRERRDMLGCPFQMPFAAESVDRAEQIFLDLRRRGVPVTTWPDLPAEVRENEAEHRVASDARRRFIFLPTDAALHPRRIMRPFRGKTQDNTGGVVMEWKDWGAPQWNEWLGSAFRSNVSQLWGYAEAKVATEGWREVRRAAFMLEGEVIAFAQFLQKTSCGFTVWRLSRGPLFFRTPLEHERRAVYAAVGRMGNVFKGNVLSICPELELTGENIAMLCELGYRPTRLRIPFHSAMVDLARSLEDIRSGLDGKWRNQLKAAENKLIALQEDPDGSILTWLVERNHEHAVQRGYPGLTGDFLKCMEKNSAQSLLVMRAELDNQPMAGLCIVRHGVAATYLIGWNGSEGRKINANNYLLWQSVVRLKALGCRWFDVGGLDWENTPGITAFKTGLNGEQYELIGEYVKVA